MNETWEKIGNVGVDAGMIWVGDPAYFINDDRDVINPGSLLEHAIGREPLTWLDFVDFYERERVGDVLAFEYLGVMTSGFGGDGTFPVEVRRGEDGLVAELRVRFS